MSPQSKYWGDVSLCPIGIDTPVDTQLSLLNVPSEYDENIFTVRVTQTRHTVCIEQQITHAEQQLD